MPVENLFQLADDPATNARIISLSLPDSLDPIEFDALNDALRSAVESHAKVIIDLAPTRYVGSAVLGMLVNVRQRIKATSGTLILCGLSPRLAQIFAVSSLTRLFTVVKTRQDALQALL